MHLSSLPLDRTRQPAPAPDAPLRSRIAALAEAAEHVDWQRGDEPSLRDDALYLVVRGAVARGDLIWSAGALISGADWLAESESPKPRVVRRTRCAVLPMDAAYAAIAPAQVFELAAWVRSPSQQHQMCFGLLPLTDASTCREWAVEFASALNTPLLPAHALDDTEGLDARRADGAVVVSLSAEPLENMTHLEEVDTLLLVCPASAGHAVRAVEERIWAMPQARRPRVSLVLLHEPEVLHPRGTRRWLKPRSLESHYHCRMDRPEDTARVSRLVSGRGVGLVLGGGGALGAGHVGVFKALGEHGIPIDFFGGTSSGGGIAAQMASGLNFDELSKANYEHFFESSPFRRLTLPIMALSPREGFDAVAHSLYGRLDIEDLWTPFFCVSTNLTRSAEHIHRTGEVWRAVRATTAVPAFAAPFVDDGDVLVDGGLLCNLPTRQMRAMGVGTVIAVDVLPLPSDAGLGYDDNEMPRLRDVIAGRVTLTAEQRRVPSIGYVLSRATALGDASSRSECREAADLLFTPPRGTARAHNFRGFDDILAAGYAYACTRLDALSPEERRKLQAPAQKLREPAVPKRHEPVRRRRNLRRLLNRLPKVSVDMQVKPKL
ncbi:MAG: patatin-like phospholipase family protein [Myxococcales bacterium]|nr:patatin-like phospholipase family protein [Myxococcales bacterium]